MVVLQARELRTVSTQNKISKLAGTRSFSIRTMMPAAVA